VRLFSPGKHAPVGSRVVFAAMRTATRGIVMEVPQMREHIWSDYHLVLTDGGCWWVLTGRVDE
jgi:hypothetical protein